MTSSTAATAAFKDSTDKPELPAGCAGSFGLTSLNYYAGLRGLRIVPTPADGNCVFHALGAQIGLSASELRKTVVKYLRDNPDILTNIDMTESGGDSGAYE